MANALFYLHKKNQVFEKIIFYQLSFSTCKYLEILHTFDIDAWEYYLTGNRNNTTALIRFLRVANNFHVLNFLNTKKEDNKIFVCKFSKNAILY